MTNLTDLLEETNLLNRKAKSPEDRIKVEENYTSFIDLAQKADDPRLAEGLNGRGLNRRLTGKRSEAYVDFLAALSSARNDEQRAESLLGQADIHRVHHGNVPAAHRCICEALTYTGYDSLLAAKAHDFRGMLLEYNEQKFSEAIEFYIMGRNIGEELVKRDPLNADYQNRLSQIVMHLVNCCLNSDTKLEEALNAGLGALSRFEALGQNTEIINMTAILGRITHKMKDYGQALAFYQQSLDTSNQLGYDRGTVPVALELAGVYLDLGKTSEASPLLERFVRGMNNQEVTESDRPSMKSFVDRVGERYDQSGLNVPGFNDVRKLF